MPWQGLAALPRHKECVTTGRALRSSSCFGWTRKALCGEPGVCLTHLLLSSPNVAVVSPGPVAPVAAAKDSSPLEVSKRQLHALIPSLRGRQGTCFVLAGCMSNCSLLQQGALLNTENYWLDFSVNGKKKINQQTKVFSIHDAQNSVVKALLQELPWFWTFIVHCWNGRWCTAVWSTWARCNHACVVPHFQIGKWVSALIHPAMNVCPKPSSSWGMTRCVTGGFHTWISHLMLWIVSCTAPIPPCSAQHNKQPLLSTAALVAVLCWRPLPAGPLCQSPASSAAASVHPIS